MKKLKIIIFTLMGFMLLGAKSVNAADLESLARQYVIDDKIVFNKFTVPTNITEFEFYLGQITKTMNDGLPDSLSISLTDCNETYTICNVRASEMDPDDYYNTIDEYTINDVTVQWATTNPIIKNIVNQYVADLAVLRTEKNLGDTEPLLFNLNDLALINYYISANSKTLNDNIVNRTFNFSESYKNFFRSSNITNTIEFRAGTSYLPFSTLAFGGMVFYYNGTAYGAFESIGIKLIESLYVPSNTELTDAALITAAERRIDEYLPNSNISITAGNPLSGYMDEFDEPIDFSGYIDLSKTTNKTYLVDFGSFIVPFVIVADSTKMTTPSFSTNDLMTNVGIVSNESSVPLDSIINVDELDEESEEYQRLAQLIGAEKMKSYDLALFSETKNSNITRLDNGKFLVSIPIPTELEGKTLIVYYVNAQNEKEAHEVTIKDGFATFETNHFSTYSLTEKTEENPQTFDGITSYVIIGIISLTGFAGTLLYINNKRFN